MVWLMSQTSWLELFSEPNQLVNEPTYNELSWLGIRPYLRKCKSSVPSAQGGPPN